jgi:hypothetical protein
MTITLDLKPEVEESLAANAKARGLSLEAYLQEIVGEQVHLAETPTIQRDKIPQIPIRHFGEIGSLRREDIYDDLD